MYPVELGFKMPPEWFPHQRTLMTWPIEEAGWPEDFDRVLNAYADVVKKISGFEPVSLVVCPENVEEARKLCGEGIDLIPLYYDDSWLRDNGPTFLINEHSEIAGINWKFNAWGEKFPYEKDDKVAGAILDRFKVPKLEAPIVMEGGSIHVDGEGTLLTTEECLLNPMRNPGLSRNEIEETVKRYIGIDKILWLPRGLDGDHTDGHVDNVACFARPGTVITQVCSDPDDPNYAITHENISILQKATDAKGRKLEVITIEQPERTILGEDRLTLSYINFYFVNGGIILPQFGGLSKARDQQAARQLQKVFPDHKIVCIDGLPIAWGGGNVHCTTQQMPWGHSLKPIRNAT